MVLTLFLLGFFRLCNTEGGRIPPPLAKIFKNGSNELKLGRVIVLHKIYQKKQEWYSMVPDFADVSTFLLLDQQNQRNLVHMEKCLKKVIKLSLRHEIYMELLQNTLYLMILPQKKLTPFAIGKIRVKIS